MKNPFLFEAQPFASSSGNPNSFKDEAFTNESLFGRETFHFQPEFESGSDEFGLEWEAPGASFARTQPSPNARGTRILWPALGFPAIIAPRQTASSNPAATDATRSICVLVLTAKPLSKEDAARYLRYVPWADRHQRFIPSGKSGAFSAQELIVRPVTLVGGQDDAKLCQAYAFGGGSSDSLVVSISTYVLKKYAAWGLTQLSEIRVSEAASQRLTAGQQYNLFWNDEQPGDFSSEMNLLLDKFASPKQQKYGRAWQSWKSSYLQEYGLEYGSRYAPYKSKDKDARPVEVLHPLFVSVASGNTIRIGHVTDTHISVRSDVFERNLAGWRLPGNANQIQFNNWNKSFESVYGPAKAHSDIVLLTGDLIDYGRGHIGQSNSGQDLGLDENYHEDRNWFLFYYLLAGNDPFNRAGRYTVPVYTTLGNHDWRLNPYPPFAPGSEDPEAFIHNYDKFDGTKERPAIMRKAHGPGWEREYSYRLNVNKHVDGLIDRIPVLRQAAAAYRAVKTAAKVGLRATGQALWGLLVSHNLDIKGTPLETTPESIAWYLLLINPFLDYQFALPGGHQFLMLDWSEDEEVKNFPDGKSAGVRAAKCLTSLQRWHVARFLASPGKAKTIGIHMPPIGPRGEWTVEDLTAGAKSYSAGAPPMVAWTRLRLPMFPLLAVVPHEGFSEWLAATYGSFLRNRTWFMDSLAKSTQHGVRLVFSGHIHRNGCLVVRPATLQIPKKGSPIPEKYQTLKVTSVSPGQNPLRDAKGPLYVNTTSAGPRGVQTSRKGGWHEWPGFSLARLVNTGVVTSVWQGLAPPAAWQTSAGNQVRQEVSDFEFEREFNEPEYATELDTQSGFCPTCGHERDEAMEVSWERETSAAPMYVRNFSGPAAECVAALTRAGKTRAQALAIINAQIGMAIRMLRVAAHRLQRGNRTDQTKVLFQRIFRVSPGFAPTWLRQTATIKDRGDVVSVRCGQVADLLASGRLRFFCTINSTNCPDCGNDNSDFACSSWGDHNVVCLGAPFWDDIRSGNRASTLSTLMHEPFHIYFGRYVTEHGRPSGESVGKFGGINCIVQFVFQINRRTPPQRVTNRCVGTAVRNEVVGV